jgi:hypothetical protein
LLGNGTTNASLQQCNNRGIPGNGVFYMVQCQANSDATMEHVTHKQSNHEHVFSVRSALRLYNEDQLPLVVGCEPVEGVSLELAVRRVGGQSVTT